jgi:hypothetical protein
MPFPPAKSNNDRETVDLMRASGAKAAKKSHQQVVTQVPKILIFRTEAKNAAGRRRLCYVFYNNNPPLLQDLISKPGSHQVIARHDF